MYNRIKERIFKSRIIYNTLSAITQWLFLLTYLTRLTGSIFVKHRSNVLDTIGLVMLFLTLYYVLTISCALSDGCYYGISGDANEFTNQ
mgnify:CR=1 FL=1